MEKISGIIGTTARLKSADVQSSAPIRPGTPTFGRPVGEVTIAHRKDLTTAQKANMLREQIAEDKKKHRDQRAVEEISNQFFMNKVEQRSIGLEPTEILAGIEGDMSPEAISEGFDDLSAEEMKYMPKGYYLNKNA